jgi:hypothetical protein
LGAKLLNNDSASSVIHPTELSHYDSKTNHCFVELKNDYSRRLYDGQTGERLAELWDGGVKTTYIKGKSNPSWDATRAFIDNAMADELKP